MKATLNKDLKYYMSLPYTIHVGQEEDGNGWYAEVEELPGCVAAGETEVEAREMLRDAMETWISISLEHGDPIPEPTR